MELAQSRVSCPYCGEPITLLVDHGDIGVEYIEDCQVCCQPMLVLVFQSDNVSLNVQVRREDE